jgi:polyhydroxyalkanoate synthesis regulator phasin
MKNFKFILKDENGNEKEIAMRLTSSDSMQIEKDYKTRLLDFVQDYSITTIVTLLKYMRKGAGDLLTSNQANDFYDELVDNGYTMADILDNIIYETLVVSGIISKEDLANIRAEKDKISKMTTEEKKKMAEERKN